MAKSTMWFFTASFVLFLSFPAVDCQWGFGLGKGGNWDWLWSNIADLDKYDLSKNSNELINNVTPKQTSNPDGTSLRRRYGRFIQSAGNSDESDDSSSEEISVGMGKTIYSTYSGSKRNDNYDNRLERQPTGGKYNNEGEEQVFNGEAGIGSGTDINNNEQHDGNSQTQSGSWKSPWTGNGSNREGTVTKQNNQGINYEKRSPQNSQGQQVQIGQGLHQGQQSTNRGQGQSGHLRYHSWADYQRQQQRRNLGEEYEPEDVTPESNRGQGQGQGHGEGNGKMGEYEAEDRVRQSGSQTTATTGIEHDWIEPEDRTTRTSVSNKKTTTATQEYEAEDVTTKAPGGSVTSGRVTFRGSTTEEYEIEGRKTTTIAPKVSKQSLHTWESGMATNPSKPRQTGQGGKAPDTIFRGRWIDIGQKPYRQNVVNSTDKNGWTKYAGSVEGSVPEKGTQTKQSWVDLNQNEKQTTNQGQTKPDTAIDPVQNGQTFPGTRDGLPHHGSINTGIRTDSKPHSTSSGNVKTSSWLDTSPRMRTHRLEPALGSEQQPNKVQLVRPEFQRERSPVHTRPSDAAVRNHGDPSRHGPASVRPNRFNAMAIPERSDRHRSAPAKPTVPSAPSPTPIMSSGQPRWRQQPTRQAPPRGPKSDQTVRTNSSPNNVHESSPEGWIDPPAINNQMPNQPSREANTNPNWNAWHDGQRNAPLPSNPIQPSRLDGQQTRQHNRVVKKPESSVHPSGQTRGSSKLHEIVRPAQPNWRVVPESANLNNVDRPKQPDWRVISGSPKPNTVDKVPTQFPAGNSKAVPSDVGQSRLLLRPDSTSGLASKHPDNYNDLPIKKPSNSIPYQGGQPVFKDINNALSSQSGDNSGNPPGDINRQHQAVLDHVTEKPVVDVAKFSKKPDTGHVTVSMKLDVSDASVQNLKTNDWGNDLNRGDFVYKPKPTEVPRGHKSKASRQNNWENNLDTIRVKQEKPRRGGVETSTFSVIKPNSPTFHNGPAIIRPTKQSRHPWSNNNIEAPVEKAREDVRNRHIKNIKNLIDQQRPSSVIRHFIEMTTESVLDASGPQGNNGLITNIDQTLSSDNPQIINLLRDIERANQRPVQGQQQKGVPRNDVIAKMSSTGVLGQHPNTIDMAPGHGSIVDGVDAEVLLNSNANLHGVINSKDSGRYISATGNSAFPSSKLENTKNRTPYPVFREAGTANDINFGELTLKVKSVNAETMPVEVAEVGGPGNVNSGSNNSVKNSQQTQKGHVSNGKGLNNGDQNLGRTNINKAPGNTGNNRVETIGGTKTVQSSIGSYSTIKPVIPLPVESSVKSEYNPSQKNINTKSNAQSSSSGSQTEGAQQTMLGTTRQQTATGALVQHRTQSRIQRPTQGGFGTPWRGGVDGGGAWKATARNEARELVMEKEGHWNSLSRGIKDRKPNHFTNRRRLV